MYDFGLHLTFNTTYLNSSVANSHSAAANPRTTSTVFFLVQTRLAVLSLNKKNDMSNFVSVLIMSMIVAF